MHAKITQVVLEQKGISRKVRGTAQRNHTEYLTGFHSAHETITKEQCLWLILSISIYQGNHTKGYMIS